MSITEITRVERFPLETTKLLGSFIDLPAPGTARDVYNFDCAGWAVGRDGRARVVEVVARDGTIRHIPITLNRPGVAREYPDVADAAGVGFWAPISVIGLDQEFDLILRVVLDDRTRVQIGRIAGRHTTVQSQYVPTIQPLLVTSLGRSGTTFLMRLLSAHPSVVAYRAYPYEMRAARYWMQLLGALIEPATQAGSANGLTPRTMQWWVHHHPFCRGAQGRDAGLQEWFGGRLVEQVAEVCQRSIEDTYRRVAATQGQTAPRYFSEKYLPDEVPGIVRELYPQAREIFLVRDLRDVLCSIRSFNAKRGSLDFSRDQVSSEQEYILHLRDEALRLLASWKSRDMRSILVRYEDLVLRPTETLTSILDYLELDSRSGRIHELLESASVATPEFVEHRTTDTATDSVGRWQRDLDADSLALCNDVFSSVLAEFGYPIL